MNTESVHGLLHHVVGRWRHNTVVARRSRGSARRNRHATAHLKKPEMRENREKAPMFVILQSRDSGWTHNDNREKERFASNEAASEAVHAPNRRRHSGKKPLLQDAPFVNIRK